MMSQEMRCWTIKGADLVTAEKPPEFAVGEVNVRSQRQLLEKLRGARELAGRGHEDVARILGASPEIVRAIEAGEYEMDLGELRQYAYAVDALVMYTVHPRAVETVHEFKWHLASAGATRNLWTDQVRAWVARSAVSKDRTDAVMAAAQMVPASKAVK